MRYNMKMQVIKRKHINIVGSQKTNCVYLTKQNFKIRQIYKVHELDIKEIDRNANPVYYRSILLGYKLNPSEILMFETLSGGNINESNLY